MAETICLDLANKEWFLLWKEKQQKNLNKKFSFAYQLNFLIILRVFYHQVDPDRMAMPPPQSPVGTQSPMGTLG